MKLTRRMFWGLALGVAAATTVAKAVVPNKWKHLVRVPARWTYRITGARVALGDGSAVSVKVVPENVVLRASDRIYVEFTATPTQLSDAAIVVESEEE